jgi:hypothetical protein
MMRGHRLAPSFAICERLRSLSDGLRSQIPNRNGFGARLLASARDPWVLLVSAFGGGAAWAFGGSIPLSVGTAVAMLGTAATVGALTAPRDEPPPQLRPGTRQQGLVILLDTHVRSLRALQTEALPDVVQAKAEDALAAADAARPSVMQMAAAVDALDDAISAARRVSGQGQHAVESIKSAIARLRSRRAELFERLTAAVDEVATVYAGLLEVSATARTMGVALNDSEVGAVNDAVTLLQMTFAELEADAANLPCEGLL